MKSYKIVSKGIDYENRRTITNARARTRTEEKIEIEVRTHAHGPKIVLQPSPAIYSLYMAYSKIEIFV